MKRRKPQEAAPSLSTNSIVWCIVQRCYGYGATSATCFQVPPYHYGPFLCKVAVYMCVPCGTRFLYVKFYRWKNDGAEFVPTLILQSDHKIVDES